jgi:hypothetical protein
MSDAALKKIDKLVALLPNEQVPVAEDRCKECFGTGRRVERVGGIQK